MTVCGFVAPRGSSNSCSFRSVAVAEDLKVDVVSSITGDFDSNVDLKSGFRVWECSIDLARYVHEHPAPVTKVLELGCGHALPGIAALLDSPNATAYLHDLDPSVLQLITSQNVRRLPASAAKRTRYVTGAWGEGLTRLLKGDAGLFGLILSSEGIYKYCSCLVAVVAITTSPVNSPAFMHFFHSPGLLRDFTESGYCLSLKTISSYTADAVFYVDLVSEKWWYDDDGSRLSGRQTSFEPLLAMLIDLLDPENGVALFAGKKLYFGCGGGTAPFMRARENCYREACGQPGVLFKTLRNLANRGVGLKIIRAEDASQISGYFRSLIPYLPAIALSFVEDYYSDTLTCRSVALFEDTRSNIREIVEVRKKRQGQ